MMFHSLVLEEKAFLRGKNHRQVWNKYVLYIENDRKKGNQKRHIGKHHFFWCFFQLLWQIQGDAQQLKDPKDGNSAFSSRL